MHLRTAILAAVGLRPPKRDFSRPLALLVAMVPPYLGMTSNLYPSPRTVVMYEGVAGSGSIFVRSRLI